MSTLHPTVLAMALVIREALDRAGSCSHEDLDAAGFSFVDILEYSHDAEAAALRMDGVEPEAEISR